MIGLLRWTFVVPVLADSFVHAADESTKHAAIITFKVIHQFAGVLLGEHLGQLFTILWTVLISIVFAKLKVFPKWISMLGYVSSFIYLLAQAELLGDRNSRLPGLEHGWLYWQYTLADLAFDCWD
jgi:hypothetical protein